MTTAYREAPKYEYQVKNIHYTGQLRGADPSALVSSHMEEMSSDGWRLVAVTDAADAWSFFWERLR